MSATTAAMRAELAAAIARRPVLDPFDREQARAILSNCAGWLRAAYKHLEARPDLADPLKNAGAAVVALERRLGLEP